MLEINCYKLKKSIIKKFNNQKLDIKIQKLKINQYKNKKLEIKKSN